MERVRQHLCKVYLRSTTASRHLFTPTLSFKDPSASVLQDASEKIAHYITRDTTVASPHHCARRRAGPRHPAHEVVEAAPAPRTTAA